MGGSALYAISVARIRTDAGIGSTVSGRLHELRLSFRTLPIGRTFMTIARGALPLRGGHMRLRLRASVLRLHSCGVFAFSNILLLRLNLEPSAADRNVSPSLHIRDARYGTTYIHHLDHLGNLRSGLSMSTTMSLLMSSRACGLTSVMIARA